jgi:hypothetical protein
LTSSVPVYASTVNEAKISNKVIKSKIKDANGNIIIEYYDANYLPESSYSNSKSKSLANKTGIYTAGNQIAALGTAPTYTSVLSGAYNNYTQCIASADSTDWIDSIFVTLTAYMAQGTYVGTDTHTNPSGWQTMNQTAFLEIYENPFNFQFGSALSQHSYLCTGYQQVSHTLTWYK